MITFFMVFPLLIVSACGVLAGLKYRARLMEERAHHDQQRFLSLGFLRKRARQDEQRPLPMSLFRKGAR